MSARLNGRLQGEDPTISIMTSRAGGPAFRRILFGAIMATSCAVIIICSNAIALNHGMPTASSALGLGTGLVTFFTLGLTLIIGYNRPYAFTNIIAVELGAILTLEVLWLIEAAVVTGFSQKSDNPLVGKNCRALTYSKTTHPGTCVGVVLEAFAWATLILLTVYLALVLIFCVFISFGNRDIWAESVFIIHFPTCYRSKPPKAPKPPKEPKPPKIYTHSQEPRPQHAPGNQRPPIRPPPTQPAFGNQSQVFYPPEQVYGNPIRVPHTVYPPGAGMNGGPTPWTTPSGTRLPLRPPLPGVIPN